jgi:hypothetical protein
MQSLAQTHTIRSLNWAHRDMSGVPLVRDFNEYFSDGLNPEQYLARLSKSARKSIRQMERRIVVDEKVQQQDILDLYSAWLDWAGKRIFRLNRTQARRFIELHYEGVADTYFVGFRDARDGKLLMAAGGEIYGLNAVNTFCKGLPLESYVDGLPIFADYWSVCYFWQRGVRGRIFNGTTCDKLKQRLGWTSIRSWKVDASKLG